MPTIFKKIVIKVTEYLLLEYDTVEVVGDYVIRKEDNVITITKLSNEKITLKVPNNETI